MIMSCARVWFHAVPCGADASWCAVSLSSRPCVRQAARGRAHRTDFGQFFFCRGRLGVLSNAECRKVVLSVWKDIGL